MKLYVIIYIIIIRNYIYKAASGYSYRSSMQYISALSVEYIAIYDKTLDPRVTQKVEVVHLNSIVKQVNLWLQLPSEIVNYI